MKPLNDIVNILATLDSKSSIEAFLFDLTSPEERTELSRRFEVAHMLDSGVSYKKIEEKTGMSSTTIARISKFLQGEKWWYKSALKILQKKESQ